MTRLAIFLQIVIALGIFNVWIIRRERATPFRPAGATNLAEEFRRYGFPDWVHGAVGGAKLLLAALLLVGIWLQPLAVVAASGLGVLMTGAVAAHVRVRDPWVKSVPALGMLLMSVAVLLFHIG